MSDLISVIVPVYKVEAFLNQCVESIINQTYHNIEIILVDDGSPDQCPDICDKWAECDSRVKVVHKENGGLSEARNVGMKVASGEYIGFVDGDDWISNNMYELLYEQMIDNSCDIVACGVQMTNDDGTPTQMLTTATNGVFNKTQSMAALIEESDLKQPVWYKLYKKSVVESIPFRVGKYHEDVFWSYQVVGKAEKVVIVNTPCYFYRQRSNSIMAEKYSLKRMDALEAKALRQKYIEQKLPELSSMAKCNLLFSCIYHMQMVIKYLNGEEKNLAIDKIWTIKKQYHFNVNDIMDLSLKQKMWALMSNVSFLLTCKIRNMLNIGF